MSIVQIKPYRPSTGHTATKTQSFGFRVYTSIFSRSALSGGGLVIFFFIGAKSALGGSGHTDYISKQAITTKTKAGVQCTHLAQNSVEQAGMNTVMELGVPQFVDHFSDCYIVKGQHS